MMTMAFAVLGTVPLCLLLAPSMRNPRAAAAA